MDNFKHQNAIPYVGGIIERKLGKETEILIQTRWKPDRDPKYSGTIEFPAGVLNNGFENIYKTLQREILEETGLQLKEIKRDSRTKKYSPQGNDESFAFKPFCCTQQLRGGLPWIGFVFLCEVYDGEPIAQKEEVKNVRWIKKTELKSLFEQHPDKFFTLEIAAWEYYFGN